jgi:hypothetical protein
MHGAYNVKFVDYGLYTKKACSVPSFPYRLTLKYV